MCKSIGVLPAVTHDEVGHMNLSLFGAFPTSTVNKVPSGKSVQPSSALELLPLPVGLISVHSTVAGFSSARRVSSLFPIRNRPSASTAAGASPI